MIKNSIIQLFLRNMLLDGMQEASIDIPILFEGLKHKNIKDTYIVEQLFTLTEFALNDRVDEGSGVYKLTVFSTVGGGLRLSDIADTIRGFFVKGEYVVSKEDNIKLYIEDASCGDELYESTSDKVQLAISVPYKKYKSL